MKLELNNVLAGGIVYGKLIKVKDNDKSAIVSTNELENFNNAITKSIGQIDLMLNQNEDIKDYLIALKLMISDHKLLARVKSKIEEGHSAYDSVKEVLAGYRKMLLEADSSYLKERAADISDVEIRILSNLGYVENAILNDKYIIAVDTLFPTFLIANKANILGVIAKSGGYTSHAAILCRSWNIPYVLMDKEIEAKDAIINTYNNILILSPTQKEIEKCADEIKKDENSYLAIPHEGFAFLANIGTNYDIDKVLEYNFDGVGLYRTEMIFMRSTRPLTYEEQLSTYLEAAHRLKDKTLCFRTFDVGDDKTIKYLKTDKKGVDNYLNNTEIFETQIKAMCMANAYNNVKIMFPMIETESEFRFLKQWVRKIAKEMNANMPKIGMMLETKKALENIESFFDADFISIGTNDLTHELYNVNREESIDNYDNYLKDLLYKIRRVVKFCNEKNIFLSVCGELAGISKTALALYNLGIRNLSVSPSGIKALNSAYKNFINIKSKL